MSDKRLQELLTEWELEDLFDLLKAEEISIEELKIMKRHHLNELLKNQKLGIRIRFEHHFEEWRRSIRKPFEISLQNNQPNFLSNILEDEEHKISTTKHNETDQKAKEQRAFISVTTKPTTTIDEKSLVLKPNIEPTDSIPCEPNSSSPLKYNHVRCENQLKDKNITVLKILLESGTKGESLLKQYEEYQTFTPLQRTLLIGLIVSYFLMKDYHLSLRTSYILEKQIVELFPNEKVEDYRGKNKGRIYMKYNNAKRRDTDFFPNKKRQRTSNTTDQDSNASDIEILPETSNQSQNPLEIMTTYLNKNNDTPNDLEAYLIKTEYLSD